MLNDQWLRLSLRKGERVNNARAGERAFNIDSIGERTGRAECVATRRVAPSGNRFLPLLIGPVRRHTASNRYYLACNTRLGGKRVRLVPLSA